jgi:hypothetical protein
MSSVTDRRRRNFLRRIGVQPVGRHHVPPAPSTGAWWGVRPHHRRYVRGGGVCLLLLPGSRVGGQCGLSRSQHRPVTALADRPQSTSVMARTSCIRSSHPRRGLFSMPPLVGFRQPLLDAPPHLCLGRDPLKALELEQLSGQRPDIVPRRLRSPARRIRATGHLAGRGPKLAQHVLRRSRRRPHGRAAAAADARRAAT